MKLSPDFQLKLRKFKSNKRAYYSFLFLLTTFVLILPTELICNVRPLLLVVDGKPYFPILFSYSEKDFGGTLPSEPSYNSESFLRLFSKTDNEPIDRLLMEEFEEEDSGLALDLGDFEEDEESAFSIELGDFEEEESTDSAQDTSGPTPAPDKARMKERDVWMLWPPVRYDYKFIPTQAHSGRVVLAAPYRTADPSGEGFIESSMVDGHYLGTDDRGRDVLARLIYGFRISMIFGLSLAITGTILGCFIGGFQGFFGGWVDLIGQRATEMWGSIPRLYILIILSSFLVPSAPLLFLILNLTAWMGIAAYIRAEFLKIRNLEYVKAAHAMGVSNFAIMRRHILPNALTPVVTFFPFEVTAGILALVSLDYLNLGVPSPAPSLGELLAQGKNNLQAIWILLPTFTVLTGTLTLLTFVGEGIRNAFDPRRSA